MANYYTLTLNTITAETTTPYSIEAVSVNVLQGSNKVTSLVEADFKLTGASGPITTNWTLDTTQATNGIYGIKFTPGHEIVNTSYLVVQVVNNTTPENISDNLFVDFAATFTSDGICNLDYTMKEAGQYAFVVDKAAGTLLDVTSPTYTFNNPPSPTNSSVEAEFAKPYLAQIITPESGLQVPLAITLMDAEKKPLTGKNELSLYAEVK